MAKAKKMNQERINAARKVLEEEYKEVAKNIAGYDSYWAESTLEANDELLAEVLDAYDVVAEALVQMHQIKEKRRHLVFLEYEDNKSVERFSKRASISKEKAKAMIDLQAIKKRAKKFEEKYADKLKGAK